MKASYNRENDILLIELSNCSIDYAEEMGPIIVHFSNDNKPVLLEILDASKFLTEATKVTIKSEKDKLVPLAI